MSASGRGGTRGFVSLREHSLVLHVDDRRVVRFDGEGRWFSASLGERNLRRGLDGGVRATRRAARGGGALDGRWLAPSEQAELHEAIRELARAALHSLEAETELRSGTDPAEARTALARALSFGPVELAAHAARFARAYRHRPVLPPDLPLAVVVELTRGPDGSPRDAADLARHVAEVEQLFGRALAMRRGLLLAPGAFALPPTALLRGLELLRPIRDRLPESPEDARGIHGVHRSGDPPITGEVLRDGAGLGLRRVYLEGAGRRVPAELDAALSQLAAAGLEIGVTVTLDGVADPGDGVPGELAWLLELPLGGRDRIVLDSSGMDGSAEDDARMAAVQRVLAAELAADGPAVVRYRADQLLPY